MWRNVPAILWLGLLVWTLFEVIQTDEGKVRNLPKVVWIALVVLVPIAGPVAWLAAGRPRPEAVRSSAAHHRPLAPDDDPDFLAGLDRRIAGPEPPHDGPPDDVQPGDASA